MKISTLLEFAINPKVEQMLDDGVARIWGGQLQRAVDDIRNMGGDSRRQTLYFASKVAEIRNLDWIIVRIQGRITYVTAERLEDNSPKEIQYGDLPLPSNEKAEIINDIAGAGLLPPYVENLWMEEGDEIEKAAAEIQDRWRAGRVASSSDDTATRVTATSNSDSTFNVDDIKAAIDSSEENSVASDGGNIEVISDTSKLNNLVSFASSGKGGLANDFDEKDAINELQTFLVGLGLNVGNNGVDGLYGRKTVAAVKKFQSAIKDLAVDGDAGPQTIRAISIVEADLLRMQELVDRHLSESFTYKSNLAKLLEADLTDAETAELQELIDKYKDFSTEFPGFMDELYTKAQEAAAGVQTFPLDNDEVVSTTDDGLGEDPRMPKVGDLSTPLMTDMLKDFDPTEYPIAGEPITIEDIEILKNETQYDKRTDPGYPYSPSNIVEPEYDAKDVEDGIAYYWREENGRITFLRGDTLERRPDANFGPWITFDPNGQIKHEGNTIQVVKNDGDEISVVSIAEDNLWSTNLVKLLKQRYPERDAQPSRINDPELNTDTTDTTDTTNTTDTDTTTNGLTIVTSPGNGVGQIQINRAKELSYTILKTSDNPPKFRYRDPGDNVSETVYDNVQDMMQDIEKFAELRRRAGTFQQ